MFTVITGRDGSGQSNTLRPLPNLYSLTPSMVVTFTGAAGVAFGAAVDGSVVV
jgi:hypothetical protein